MRKCDEYNEYSCLCAGCDFPSNIKCSKKVKKCVRCCDFVEEERFDADSAICIDCKYEMIEAREMADGGD